MTGDLAAVRAAATDTGRVDQKRRTRRALVDAARELVDEGASPTLAEVAERALVSRTTAYRYFASAEALIEEVFFDRHFPTVDDVIDPATGPRTRALAVEAAVNDTLLAHETAMRVIVRNALESALSGEMGASTRSGRRRALIDAALAPLDDQLPPERLHVLQHALALAIGPEAIITMRDVCGLDPVQARTITRWATDAMIEQALGAHDAQP